MRFTWITALSLAVVVSVGHAGQSAHAQVPGFRKNVQAAEQTGGQPAGAPQDGLITPVTPVTGQGGDAALGGNALDVPTSVDMRPWYLRSPLPDLNLPIPTLPRPRFLQPPTPGDVRAPVRERLPRPRQIIANSRRRIANRTRATWQQTKELFGFDSDVQQPPPQVARQNEQGGFLSRLFGSEEPETPEGPQTMTEWLAQERLNP